MKWNEKTDRLGYQRLQEVIKDSTRNIEKVKRGKSLADNPRLYGYLTQKSHGLLQDPIMRENLQHYLDHKVNLIKENSPSLIKKNKSTIGKD